MEREDALRSKEYWLAKMQTQLYGIIEDYKEKKGLNRTELAKELHVTKGYISQVLNGDFNHRISKLVELALSVGKVPYNIEYRDLNELIEIDKLLEHGAVYNCNVLSATVITNFNDKVCINNFYTNSLGDIDIDKMTSSPYFEYEILSSEPLEVDYEERKKLDSKIPQMILVLKGIEIINYFISTPPKAAPKSSITIFLEVAIQQKFSEQENLVIDICTINIYDSDKKEKHYCSLTANIGFIVENLGDFLETTDNPQVESILKRHVFLRLMQ